MNTTGFDTTRPLDPAAVRRHGGSAVGSYVGPFRKAIRKNVLDAYLVALLGVWFIWETTASRALAGYAAGMRDARRANAALDKLGVPVHVPIAWTVDTNAAPKMVLAYAQGWKAASARPAVVYGSAGVIDAVVDAGLAIAGWQTNARGWDRPRRYSRHARMRQHLPANLDGLGWVDPNTIDDNCPLVWWPASHPLSQQPTDPPPPGFPGRVLHPGTTGADVAVWAVILRCIGYWGFNLGKGSAEIYGPGKVRATKRFQKRHGLVPDGMVGPKTWAAAVKLLTEKRARRRAARRRR